MIFSPAGLRLERWVCVRRLGFSSSSVCARSGGEGKGRRGRLQDERWDREGGYTCEQETDRTPIIVKTLDAYNGFSGDSHYIKFQ